MHLKQDLLVVSNSLVLLPLGKLWMNTLMELFWKTFCLTNCQGNEGVAWEQGLLVYTLID